MKVLIKGVVVFSIIFFSLNNCKKHNIQNVPFEFVDLLNEFISEANLRGNNYVYEELNISIELGKLEEPLLGYCRTYRNEIVIDSSFWSNTNEYGKKRLLFHELGHCLLDRDHRNDELLFNICSSIMKEGGNNCCVIEGSNIWWDYYLDELFDSNESENFLDWITSDSSYTIIDVFENKLTIDTFATKLITEFPSVMFNNLDTFAIEISFDNWMNSDDLIAVSTYGIDFQYCNCSSKSIRIKDKESGNEYYYSNRTYEEEKFKFSIVRINDRLNLYINEEFILVLQNKDNYNLIDLITNRFHTNVDIKVEVLTK